MTTGLFGFVCFDSKRQTHVRVEIVWLPKMVNLLENLCLSEHTSLAVDQESVQLLPVATDSAARLRYARDILTVFTQQNFVGCRRDVPGPTDTSLDYRAALEVDSEQLNVNVRNPELLWQAKGILKELHESAGEDKNPLLLIWQLRSIVIHQHVLDERTGGLYEQFQASVAAVESILEQQDVFVRACVALEVVQGFVLFRRITEAGVWLKKVKELLKTQLKLVSMLGFRTRFQTKPVPQLALKVISAMEDELPKSSDTHSTTQLPKLLLLEDDTRLEKVKFVNEEHGQIGDLPSIIQCLIITEM